MTTKPHSFIKVCLLVAACLFSNVQLSSAQVAYEEMQTNTLTQLKNRNWQEALKLTTETIDALDARAPTLFGAKFGWMHYYQGYCRLKLRDFAGAMASFETCYIKYPNKVEREEAEKQNQSYNMNHKKALLRWAEAAVGAKDYDTASKMYAKFIKERSPTDKYNRGSYFINVGISHLKKTAPDAEAGIENLQTAIDNKENFRSSDANLMQGLRAVAEFSLINNKEQVVIDFVNKNRGVFQLPPHTSHRYASLFMKLAGDAYNQEFFRMAFMLYSLVPSTEEAIDDVKALIESFEPRAKVQDGRNVYVAKVLKAELEKLQTSLGSGNPNEEIALRATGAMHKRMGNPRGAYAAFQQLETYYPRSKNRESNLYYLVVFSSEIGEIESTEQHGHEFLKRYPGSEHAPEVERLMLSALYFNREYVKCIEIAGRFIKGLEEGSERHDLTLHVLGGSLYYEGRYAEANDHLKSHTALYKDSKFHLSSRYIEASNASRLQDNVRAAILLDKFLKDFPDPSNNSYLPLALFDRANVHYALDEFEQALEVLGRLEKNFADAAIIDVAYNLKGNVLETENQPETAKEYYLKALEVSERRNNTLVASDSLSFLVSLLGKEGPDKDITEAIPYYDKFWAKYAALSDLRPKVAVQGLAAMIKAGRGKEGLAKLRDVISDMARGGNTLLMEKTINSYTEAYLKEHTTEELKKHYFNFPGIDNQDKATLALLRIALIGVYEKELKDAEDEEKQRLASANIKINFQGLKSDFNPKTLSPYILVRLGDYLRTKTNAPREAIAYYEESIVRNDPKYTGHAQFGLADILGVSADAAENTRAISLLDALYQDKKGEKLLRENALFRIVKIHEKNVSWPDVNKVAATYLEEKNFNTHSPDVSMLYALSYENQAQVDSAIKAHLKTFGANLGNIRISAPTVERMAKLVWNRNKDQDRQLGYNTLAKYIQDTERFYNDRMTDEEKTSWDAAKKLMLEYEKSGQVKTLAQQKAEQEG